MINTYMNILYNLQVCTLSQVTTSIDYLLTDEKKMTKGRKDLSWLSAQPILVGKSQKEQHEADDHIVSTVRKQSDEWPSSACFLLSKKFRILGYGMVFLIYGMCLPTSVNTEIPQKDAQRLFSW